MSTGSGHRRLALTATRRTRNPVLFWANLALKAALVGLLAFGAFSGLDQFQGKAFGTRLLFYPLSAVIVPIAWRLRGRPQPYPYAPDMLIVAPFLVDVVGNALDLYDSVSWWDDVNHFANWALLCGALGTALLRTRLRPWLLFSLVTGFGAVTAILWEIAEYLTFIRGGPEEATAYTDTLGDEILGLSGAATAAALVALAARRRRRTGSEAETPSPPAAAALS